MKVHIVRQPFSFEGKDYARGAEISDPNLLAALKKTPHARHLIQQHHEMPAGAPPAG